MKILQLFAVLVTALVLVACSDQADLQSEIEAKVNAELEKAGVNSDLAKLNYEDLNQPVDSNREAIKLSGNTKEVNQKIVTAGSIWKEVEAFAKELHDGAVFVGYNNHSTTFSNKYLIPNDKFIDGKSNFWVYFFVKDSSSIADEFIDEESEAFGVLFDEGELSYVSVEVYPEDVSAKELTGSGWFSVDTDKLVERAKKKIYEDYEVDKFISVDFDCIPTWPITFATGQGECRLTFYDAPETGFFVDVIAITGQVESVESVKFQKLY